MKPKTAPKTQFHIFVSRSLDKHSPFRQLEETGHTVVGQSLIDFEEIPFEVPEHDAVFFYSQKAIRPYIKAVGYSSNKVYGVMGPASQAAFLKHTGHKAQIEGKGEGTAGYKALEENINETWSGKRVLFPVARRSMKRFKKGLPNLTQLHVIIYNNTVKKNIELPACEILAFTSPLNVEAYSIYRNLDEAAAIFAIGRTTAKKISKYTSRELLYCEDPSEANLYKLVVEFISA